ncbi:MAG: hypothetical protein QF415_14380 [Candidatus Undinarchaeales archaeon]|jgi:hypothetical protein|nr:hypothetical protein [Candidatus Undinarchaeales archaeon]MDP7491489.1 hypothetical protein [Candidatus Undinarchaeales archaeon]
MAVNINELLSKHVTLDIECMDRIYLNGYIPTLQTSGQLVYYLRERGYPIPSPALFKKMTTTFKARVELFARDNYTPIIHFKRGERKDDIAAKYLKKFDKEEGVVFIGIAQERAIAFKGYKKVKKGRVYFDLSRQPANVNHIYFYIKDKEFGPGFIKVCTYVPFPVKVCLNGHEWAKQQLRKEGIPFEPLDNGFRSCTDPERLQEICDRLGPTQIREFFTRWRERLPWPLSDESIEAGYGHKLSIWQMEVSRTQVFDRPQNGRRFFEGVIRENIDLGRPDGISVVFDRRITKATPGKFRTRVINQGVHPSLHFNYKRNQVKQYFKENRALRTETTINNPKDFRVNKGLDNLPYLQKIGRMTNRRLLDVERVSQDCALSQEGVERVVQPTVTEDGRRASGLRFGDKRVMCLFLTLTLFLHAAHGFTHKDLRMGMADLLDDGHTTYLSGQMTYDLRRLRLKGIIWRVPHTNSYLLTPYGMKVSMFFTKMNARVFGPGFAAMEPDDPIPRPLARAFRDVDREIGKIIDGAMLSKRAPKT